MQTQVNILYVIVGVLLPMLALVFVHPKVISNQSKNAKEIFIVFTFIGVVVIEVFLGLYISVDNQLILGVVLGTLAAGLFRELRL